MLSQTRLKIITAAIMLSIFLASMEGTVVSTAMPTIVAQLGGLSIYSWVFSIYMLTSTTTVPLYGKLSDILGRKRVFTFSMGLFLLGSLLCGQARDMNQIIIFRAVQGLGAGGVLPLAFTIIGELFTFEERARLQGLFSGVWGVSSVIGPLIGGFLVDTVSWQWVFYINLIPGLLAIGLLLAAWQERPRAANPAVPVDYLGAALLTVGILCLLFGLETGGSTALLFLTAAAGLLAVLVWVEMRAADPILPLALFRDRLFTVSIIHGVLSGWSVFGSLTFVPLFVQAVLGTTATQAGITLTPMSLNWTTASILCGRLLLKVGYRTLALIGMALVTAGTLLMSLVSVETSQVSIMVFLSLIGAGMGLSIPAFMIAVQSSVQRSQLGIATSTVQFSRSIGGTIGVSVLGAFLSARLASVLMARGMNSNEVSLDGLLDPVNGTALAVAGPVREGLSIAIANLFFIAFIAALLGLLSVLFTPAGKVAQIERTRSEQVAAQAGEVEDA